MTPRYRVVIHASERDRAALALNNAKNLIAGLGAERVEAEVVAYADGVEGLRAGGPNAALMDLLASYGTRLACANTSPLPESDCEGLSRLCGDGPVRRRGTGRQTG